jgi:integrase
MEMFIWAVTILLQRYAPPPGVIIKKRISVHTLRHSYATHQKNIWSGLHGSSSLTYHNRPVYGLLIAG